MRIPPDDIEGDDIRGPPPKEGAGRGADAADGADPRDGAGAVATVGVWTGCCAGITGVTGRILGPLVTVGVPTTMGDAVGLAATNPCVGTAAVAGAAP